MGHLILSGDNTTFPGFSLLDESSLATTLDDTGTLGFTLAFLVLRGTTSVSIASTGATGGYNTLSQLDETNNDLTTVTIIGSEAFHLRGLIPGEANVGDGVVTDIAGSLGGGVLGQIVTLALPSVMAAAESGNLSVGGVISQLIAGGAGGAILTAIIGAIKNKALA